MSTEPSEREEAYCESCDKAHPTPRDAAHREALQCKGVWYFADRVRSFKEQVEGVVAPIMSELEAALLSKVDAALDKAFDNGATRMRERCVEKVRELGEQWRQEASKAGRMFSDKTAIATKIAAELQSLTLDGEKER